MLNKYMALYSALPLTLDAHTALQALAIADGLETHLATSSLLPGSDSHRFVTDRIRDARRRVRRYLLTLVLLGGDGQPDSIDVTTSRFTHSLTTKQLVDACEWVAAHPGTEEEALKDLASCRHDSAQEEALVIETAIALGR